MLCNKIMWVTKKYVVAIKKITSVTPKTETRVDYICLVFHKKGIHFFKK